jgi:DNA-binding PadR family transcriptional regulator
VEDVRDIEKALLAYWRGNPTAIESLEGIARWWPMTSMGKIRKALDRLVESGVVEVDVVTSGRNLYHLKQK